MKIAAVESNCKDIALTLLKVSYAYSYFLIFSAWLIAVVVYTMTLPFYGALCRRKNF